VQTPPSAEHPLIKDAAKRLSKHFATRFSKGDIDSLSVAVVSSEGAVYEENFGVMRGNESLTSPKTTSHSMYRIASITKLFTVLEGLVLQQKGALSWYAMFLEHDTISKKTKDEAE
jgi:CubicO group peptidase (beta-lactamase class C family)